MELKQIKNIAENTLLQLKPYCKRIAIAGSIRRKKPFPNDIEIVAIPEPYDIGLFESGIATVINKWKKIKGELPCKYTKRLLPEGVTLDLFFAKEENWGLIFAIRTGSAEFSHKTLANTWVRNGFKSENGMLWRNMQKYPCKEELDLFKLLNLKYIDPENRI